MGVVGGVAAAEARRALIFPEAFPQRIPRRAPLKRGPGDLLLFLRVNLPASGGKSKSP
ncbi:hypothetical protein [Lysobacter gummosus]|uniref:hypothetical protein n=1 Tax=Lysobacter gummosus TaxID=262324 RepID=UPI003637374A